MREERVQKLLLLRRRRLLERVEREEAGYFGKQPVVLQRDRVSCASERQSQLCFRETAAGYFGKQPVVLQRDRVAGVFCISICAFVLVKGLGFRV